MTALASLVYLSLGNLPSKWAHTGQIANMAQSLAQQIDDFELVTGGDVASLLNGKRLDAGFRDWYNLGRGFKLVRLPVQLKATVPFPKSHSSRRYIPLAVLYACLRSPSLVYTRTLKIAEWLLALGVPVLWECHAPLEDAASHRAFFTNTRLVGVVTTGSRLADGFMAQGLPPDKVLMVPNAVELGDFLPALERDEARRQLGLPQEAGLVLYAGHLYDYKGIPTILEVARQLPERQFALVGGWKEDVQRVEATCREAGLANVHVLGHVPKSKLATYLYAADVLILPTSKTWEEAEVTNPLKLFEYMAVRRPIVASALPNITSILRDGDNALLAVPDDPQTFTDAIVALFDAPDRAARLAETAYREVQHFTWDRRAERVLRFAREQLHPLPPSSAGAARLVFRFLKSWYAR